MNKYKIIYIDPQGKELNYFYVKGHELPIIPNYDHIKYEIDDSFIPTKIDDSSYLVKVYLKERVVERIIEIYINNQFQRNIRLITNYTKEKISLEGINLQFENALGNLYTNDGIHFKGLIPNIGYEIKYSILSKNDTKLNISIFKIIFENTTGKLTWDENYNLGGLIPNPGFIIKELKLKEDNKISFIIENQERGNIQRKIDSQIDKISLIEEFSSDYYKELDKTKIMHSEDFEREKEDYYKKLNKSKKKSFLQKKEKIINKEITEKNNTFRNNLIKDDNEEKFIKKDIINSIRSEYLDENNSFTRELSRLDRLEHKKNNKKVSKEKVNETYGEYINNLHVSGTVAYSLLKSMKNKK